MIANSASSYSPWRTLRIIELLAERPRTTQETADLIPANVRTTRRILQRLRADGYVTKGAGFNDPWTASDQLRELGAQLARSRPPAATGRRARGGWDPLSDRRGAERAPATLPRPYPGWGEEVPRTV